MSVSDSSALSSPPSSDDEAPNFALNSYGESDSGIAQNGASHATAERSPAQSKRPKSPPHEFVLADNPDIAVSRRPVCRVFPGVIACGHVLSSRRIPANSVKFIVMFRSRFSEAFPKNLAHFGPQDIEKGVSDPVPTPQIESLLCALLGLVLNRKKYVESVLCPHHRERLLN